MGDETLYSLFANDAYNYLSQPGARVPFASDYIIIATSHGNWSGYDGFAAPSLNECKVVVGNAGTDRHHIRDLLADAELAFLGTNRQTGDSIALTKNAVSIAPGLGYADVIVVQRAVGCALAHQTFEACQVGAQSWFYA